jgi:hypothetical protein
MNYFLTTIGQYVIFNFYVITQFPELYKRLPLIIKQMKRVGYDSLFLISITSAFTGLVTSVQASYQTSGYIPENLIGVLVVYTDTGKETDKEIATRTSSSKFLQIVAEKIPNILGGSADLASSNKTYIKNAGSSVFCI